MPIFTELQVRQRLRDVETALMDGDGITDLGKRWGITKSATCQFLDRHLSQEKRRTLGENGRNKVGKQLRSFDLCSRLELIRLCRSAGWEWQKISAAIGVSYHALYVLVAHHAPDSIDAAIEDLRDEAA